MKKIIKELFSTLTIIEKRNLIVIQFYNIIVGFLEVLGLALIVPYFNLISNIQDFYNNWLILTISNYVNLNNYSSNSIIVFLSLTIIFIFFISTVLTLYVNWRILLFSQNIGADFSKKLFNFYLSQNFDFHLENDPNTLVAKLTSQINQVAGGIILSFITILSKFIISIILISLLIFYNPSTTIVMILFLSLIFIIFAKLLINKVITFGEERATSNMELYRRLSNAFGSIKEIIIYQKQRYFIKIFNINVKKIAINNAYIQAIGTLPKNIIEFLTIVFLIMFVIFISISDIDNSSDILSILALYGVSGLRLLPNFQNIYNSYIRFQSSIPNYNLLKKDLISTAERLNKFDKPKNAHVSFSKSLILKEMNFYYNKDNFALKNINIEIPINQKIGIVGYSGSGKSTLVNILSGLLLPSNGSLIIDNEKINKDNLYKIYNLISYISQNFFIQNATILENIILGDIKDYDKNKLEYALEVSQCSEFVNLLENKFYTKIGEGGSNLSGGQRQRIAIARAIYANKKIIILDEATNSLDLETEKKILNKLFSEKNKTIILIAHRMSLYKLCDKIYVINNGIIEQSGKYSEVLEKSLILKSLNILDEKNKS